MNLTNLYDHVSVDKEYHDMNEILIGSSNLNTFTVQSQCGMLTGYVCLPSKALSDMIVFLSHTVYIYVYMYIYIYISGYCDGFPLVRFV